MWVTPNQWGWVHIYGHVVNCFKINDKQMVKMAQKGETVKFKNYTRKIKSPFMIYSDFESILVPENNGK